MKKKVKIKLSNKTFMNTKFLFKNSLKVNVFVMLENICAHYKRKNSKRTYLFIC